MGVKERREREKIQLKKAIIDAALTLATENGWQSVTMRKIAEIIEYSPPTIYEHFRSKDDLLFEIMKKGFMDLHQNMIASIEPSKSSKENILTIFDVYWNYSLSNKVQYQVMYELGRVTFGAEQTPIEIKEVFHLLKKSIGDLPHFKDKSEQYITDVTDIVWGNAHGIVALTMFNRIAGGEERGHQLFKISLLDILKLSEL